MKTRFIHMADLHLGFQQYGSEARYNDFARAWLWCCDYAIEREADFVLIAGDLFHSQQPGPMTVMQAVEGLSRLCHAGVRVFAVEGNHDRARLSDGASWLEFLDEQQLLTLLYADSVSDGAVNMNTAVYRGCQIMGLQYFGSSLPKVLEMLSNQPRNNDYPVNILMLHGGLEGEVPFAGNFSIDDLNPLRQNFDYIALGHVHKYYERDGWAYNPGSPEVCDIQESGRTRYILDVTVDTDTATKDVLMIPVPSREFVRASIDVSECLTWAELVHDMEFTIEPMGTGAEQLAVLEITLTGTLQFPRSELAIEHLKERANESHSYLLVRIVNKTSPTAAVSEIDSDASRPEIEFQVMTDIVDRDKRWNNTYGDITKLVIRTKELSLNGHDAAEIAHLIQEAVTC